MLQSMHIVGPKQVIQLEGQLSHLPLFEKYPF